MADGGAAGGCAEVEETVEHCCEICGLEGLSDEAMRAHTVSCHVEGRAECPFCGLWGVSSAELLLHVNQAHLDYLTPENELMTFIDDQSPSIDGDSDTLSDCRGASPSLPNLWPRQNAPKINNINQYASLNGLHTNRNVHNDFSLDSYRSNSDGHSSYNTGLHLNGTSSNGAKSKNAKPNVNAHKTSSKGNVNLIQTKLSFSKTVTKSNETVNRNVNDKVNVHSVNNRYSLVSEKDKKELQNGTRNKVRKGDSGPTSNGQPDSNGSDLLNGQPGRAGQGSPLRSQLGLKLKSHTQTASAFQCPLCPHSSDSAPKLEEHINRAHFDPTSPSVSTAHGLSSTMDTTGLASARDAPSLLCPLCARGFQSGSDLELHVNIEHRDILSPEQGAVSIEAPLISNARISDECPMCNANLSKLPTQQEIDNHIESHFTRSPQMTKPSPDVELAARKLREQREFEMLRAQYGMDDQGNFREQSATAMQRAVYAGEMSVADYYERQIGLRAAESHGVDDSSSCTKGQTRQCIISKMDPDFAHVWTKNVSANEGIASRVHAVSSVSPGVMRTLICSAADHYASSYGDRGWGCGYRNLQMMLSSLLQNTSYNEALYSAWGGNGPSRTAMPSISRLQRMVEAAWAQGFDLQGSEQLGSKLHNTRKWIGATEVVTLLSWLRIRCQLMDFHRPTSPDGGHPDMFQWVLAYFQDPQEFKPPLYLQHQGHSRTIIGIEQRHGGSLTLLILDPSHGPRQMSALTSQASMGSQTGPQSAQAALRLLRRGPGAMRAQQYQLVVIRGLIDTEEQYEQSKILRSIRMPQDR